MHCGVGDLPPIGSCYPRGRGRREVQKGGRRFRQLPDLRRAGQAPVFRSKREVPAGRCRSQKSGGGFPVRSKGQGRLPPAAARSGRHPDLRGRIPEKDSRRQRRGFVDRSRATNFDRIRRVSIFPKDPESGGHALGGDLGGAPAGLDAGPDLFPGEDILNIGGQLSVTGSRVIDRDKDHAS